MNNKIQFKIGNSGITLILCTITILLAQISETIDNLVYMYAGYTLILAWSFICDYDSIFGCILFLLADNSILDIGGISIQLILMFVYFIRVITNGEFRFNKNILLLSCVIAVYSLIYYPRGIAAVLQGVKFAVMMLYLYHYLNSREIDFNYYIYVLTFAVIGLSISVMSAVIVDPQILLESRVSLSEDSNHNMLGILGAVLFSNCFFTYIKKPSNKILLCAILSSISALISTSRTALTVIAVSVAWGLLTKQNDKRGTLRKIVIIIVISAFVVAVLSGVIEISYISKLIDRIVNPRRGDISNGRFTLWIEYISFLANNWNVLFLGYGKTTVEGITTLTSDMSIMAHNMYIEQITMYGIIGTMVVVALYRSVYNSIKLKSNNLPFHVRFSFALNIIIIFILGMFSHVITSVLVTMELFIGIIQYISFCKEEQFNRE